MDKMGWCAMCVAALVLFLAGMRFQLYRQAEDVRETIALYNRVVQFNNKLVELMHELDGMKKAACARVQT